MSNPQRMRAWGTAVSAGHLALGALGWLVLEVPGSPLFFGLCAVLTMGIALIGAPLLRPRRPDDGGDGPRRDARGPDDPPPPWWPDFERAFREYADRKPLGRA